nr:hypothetical protein [Massilimicrobiota timonensis]
MQLSQFPQFEIIILHLLKQQDFSGEHIYQILNKHFQIIEGDILISLFFLQDTHLISSYSLENIVFYHIEDPGLVRYTTLKREYQNIHQSMEALLQNEKNKNSIIKIPKNIIINYIQHFHYTMSKKKSFSHSSKQDYMNMSDNILIVPIRIIYIILDYLKILLLIFIITTIIIMLLHI